MSRFEKFQSFTLVSCEKSLTRKSDNNPSILLREDNNRSHLISQSQRRHPLGWKRAQRRRFFFAPQLAVDITTVAAKINGTSGLL